MNNLLLKLHELGLPGREAEIYLALLQKNELTAPEISKITSVSRTKCYDILLNLVKKNLCTENYKNGQKTYSAIKPSIALDNLLSVHQEELLRKQQLADACKTELMNLYTVNGGSDKPMDYIEVLTDPGQIRARWMEIQAGTTKELIGFTKPPYTRKLSDNLENESEVLRRKVSIKSIYESKQFITPDEKSFLVSVVESYKHMGEATKICDELPMKLVISDETITMFALNDRVSLKPSITTMIVNHPSFAAAMKKVFESYWNASLELEEYIKNNI